MSRKINRRTTLKTIGVAGIAGLAGCSNGSENSGDGAGDGGGDGNADGASQGTSGNQKTNVIMTWASTDQAMYVMGQAVANVINEHHDTITVDARPSSGGKQSMAKVAQGDSDFGFLDLYTANKIKNQVGEFSDNPIDLDLTQAWHLLDLVANWGTRQDTGIKTTADFKGKRIGTLLSAGGFHDYILANLSKVLDPQADMTSVEVPTDQEGTALRDGRVAAVTDTQVNGHLVPGYEQQQHSLNSNSYRIVGWPETAVEKIKQDNSLTGSYYTAEQLGTAKDRDQPFGWGDREKIWWMEQIFTLWVRPDFDPNVLKEMMLTLYNNADQLKNQHPLLADWAGSDNSFEYWSNKLADWVPVHEGSKKFFDEVGLKY